MSIIQNSSNSLISQIWQPYIMPGKAAELYKSFLRKKTSNKNYAKWLCKEFGFSSTVKIDFAFTGKPYFQGNKLAFLKYVTWFKALQSTGLVQMSWV